LFLSDIHSIQDLGYPHYPASDYARHRCLSRLSYWVPWNNFILYPDIIRKSRSYHRSRGIQAVQLENRSGVERICNEHLHLSDLRIPHVLSACQTFLVVDTLAHELVAKTWE
jgi:hypothetical protein